MSVEKIAVLVLTGLIAVLLAVAIVNGEDRRDALGPGRAGGIVDARLPVRTGGAGSGTETEGSETRQTVFDDMRKGTFSTPKIEAIAKPSVVDDAPAFENVTVKRGDTLERIARRVWGNGALWTRLRDANPKVDARRLREGMVLRAPVAKPRGGLARNGSPAGPQTGTQNGTEKGAKDDRSGPGGRTHRVRRGETLSRIAQKHLGRDEAWKEILAANPDVLTDPRRLREGMVLRIP